MWLGFGGNEEEPWLSTRNRFVASEESQAQTDKPLKKKKKIIKEVMPSGTMDHWMWEFIQLLGLNFLFLFMLTLLSSPSLLGRLLPSGSLQKALSLCLMGLTSRWTTY